jgi:hypothetical protein
VTRDYTGAFFELVRTPFQHIDLVWGVVPLYFGWVLNELTSTKATFRTAINTGFSFVWAAAHWTYQLFGERPGGLPRLDLGVLVAVNVAVTVFVFLVGCVALVSGLRRKFPRYGSFLGHARFSNYFMIAIFPMQSGYLPWTWLRVQAIALFALPIWLILHFGLMPLRRK